MRFDFVTFSAAPEPPANQLSSSLSFLLSLSSPASLGNKWHLSPIFSLLFFFFKYKKVFVFSERCVCASWERWMNPSKCRPGEIMWARRDKVGGTCRLLNDILKQLHGVHDVLILKQREGERRGISARHLWFKLKGTAAVSSCYASPQVCRYNRIIPKRYDLRNKWIEIM